MDDEIQQICDEMLLTLCADGDLDFNDLSENKKQEIWRNAEICLEEEKMEKAKRKLNAKELPKIGIGTKDYYVDKRLCQLRNVDNPHDYIEY